MDRIEVGRYEHSETHGWAGWLNPERAAGEAIPPWALFVDTGGHVSLGIRDERGELVFSNPQGPGHPRTFTREPDEPRP